MNKKQLKKAWSEGKPLTPEMNQALAKFGKISKPLRTTKLSFQRANAKLEKDTATFSLPAGWTCPSAKLCLSRSNRITGKLTDGKENKFRCFASNAENLFPNVRKSRWHNFELLRGKTTAEMASLISKSLPIKGVTLCRIHVSGDFFSQAYFDAWIHVAMSHPNIIFYAYTKQLPLWIKRQGYLPDNFRLTASYGGIHDDLIVKHKLRSAKVVFTEAEAGSLPIDHDDTHAWKTKEDFALLLHGTQPAKTPAALAWQLIKTKGRGGYSRNNRRYFGKKVK